MNGMQYMRPSFTLPASNNASQTTWDFSTLTEKEFSKKYDISPKIYGRVKNGETLDEVMATYRRV